MSAVEEIPQGKIMPFALRPLEEADTAQTAEIERDAFPTLFPPTPFRRELRNRMAQYLVAWRRVDLGAANLDPSAADYVEAPRRRRGRSRRSRRRIPRRGSRHSSRAHRGLVGLFALQ